VILFGHPTGGPFSFNAALAYYDAGMLEAFCIPWMPTPMELAVLRRVPGLSSYTARLTRRYFQPLLNAPKIQGRCGEWVRMAKRLFRLTSDDVSAWEANDWLMRTMSRACEAVSVDVVHAYEDCSLWQFENAKRLNKTCVYDMPIGYYRAWEETQRYLTRKFLDWVPRGQSLVNQPNRTEQKQRELDLADLVLVPSTFVENTIRKFAETSVARIPYGVDSEFWRPSDQWRTHQKLRFIYAGQITIRKGIPVLLEAWRRAALPEAELELVGTWGLAEKYRHQLPGNVRHLSPCSPEQLRMRYQAADVFVFPSFFEGLGLVLLEAMACGLPVIASNATGGPDILDSSTGFVVNADDTEMLTETLRWFAANRDRLPAFAQSARRKAEQCTWQVYRTKLLSAIQGLG
jgi:starch synthase